MAAIANDHVAMQLFLQRHHVGRWVACGGESFFVVSAWLVDHDAVGIGRVHELLAGGRVARTLNIAALRGQQREVAPLLFFRNGRSQPWIVVAPGAAP